MRSLVPRAIVAAALAAWALPALALPRPDCATAASSLPPRAASAATGSEFARRIAAASGLERDALIMQEIRLPRASIDVCAQCVLELIWVPENLVLAGTRSALAIGRDTLLRGAATR